MKNKLTGRRKIFLATACLLTIFSDSWNLDAYAADTSIAQTDSAKKLDEMLREQMDQTLTFNEIRGTIAQFTECFNKEIFFVIDKYQSDTQTNTNKFIEDIWKEILNEQVKDTSFLSRLVSNACNAKIRNKDLQLPGENKGALKKNLNKMGDYLQYVYDKLREDLTTQKKAIRKYISDRMAEGTQIKTSDLLSKALPLSNIQDDTMTIEQYVSTQTIDATWVKNIKTLLEKIKSETDPDTNIEEAVSRSGFRNVNDNIRSCFIISSSLQALQALMKLHNGAIELIDRDIDKKSWKAVIPSETNENEEFLYGELWNSISLGRELINFNDVVGQEITAGGPFPMLSLYYHIAMNENGERYSTTNKSVEPSKQDNFLNRFLNNLVYGNLNFTQACKLAVAGAYTVADPSTGYRIEVTPNKLWSKDGKKWNGLTAFNARQSKINSKFNESLEYFVKDKFANGLTRLEALEKIILGAQDSSKDGSKDSSKDGSKYEFVQTCLYRTSQSFSDKRVVLNVLTSPDGKSTMLLDGTDLLGMVLNGSPFQVFVMENVMNIKKILLPSLAVLAFSNGVDVNAAEVGFVDAQPIGTTDSFAKSNFLDIFSDGIEGGAKIASDEKLSHASSEQNSSTLATVGRFVDLMDKLKGAVTEYNKLVGSETSSTSAVHALLKGLSENARLSLEKLLKAGDWESFESATKELDGSLVSLIKHCGSEVGLYMLKQTSPLTVRGFKTAVEDIAGLRDAKQGIVVELNTVFGQLEFVSGVKERDKQYVFSMLQNEVFGGKTRMVVSKEQKTWDKAKSVEAQKVFALVKEINEDAEAYSSTVTKLEEAQIALKDKESDLAALNESIEELRLEVVSLRESALSVDSDLLTVLEGTQAFPNITLGMSGNELRSVLKGALQGSELLSALFANLEDSDVDNLDFGAMSDAVKTRLVNKLDPEKKVDPAKKVDTQKPDVKKQTAEETPKDSLTAPKADEETKSAGRMSSTDFEAPLDMTDTQFYLTSDGKYFNSKGEELRVVTVSDPDRVVMKPYGEPRASSKYLAKVKKK